MRRVFKELVERSYAEIAKSGISADEKSDNEVILNSVIKDAWRKEEAEDIDRQQRVQNVLVHDVSEQDLNKDKAWAA